MLVVVSLGSSRARGMARGMPCAVCRVPWRGSAAAVQPHLEGCSGGLGDSGIWLRDAPAEERWEVITSEVRDGCGGSAGGFVQREALGVVAGVM